jgi:hypothetical protein
MYLLTIKSTFVKQAQLLEEERKGKCILQGLSVLLLQTATAARIMIMLQAVNGDRILFSYRIIFIYLFLL